MIRQWMRRLAICFVVLVVVAGSAFAQHTVTPWRDQKAGAVSLTFDDGWSVQLSFAIPNLDARGFKGTFFLITGTNDTNNIADWNPWVAAANSGHELGSHTVTHRDLTTLSLTDAQAEIVNSKAAIESHLGGKKCVSLAYPYGTSNDSIKTLVQSAGYIDARAVIWTLNGSPYNFYNLSAFNTEITFDQMKAYTETAGQQGTWLVTLFHGFDGPSGDWLSSQFIAYLDYLKGKNLWVAPVGSVVKYIKERDAASLYLVSQTSSKIVLRLTATALDSTIFNEPLTIRSTVPASWAQVKFQQGSSTQTLTPVTEGSGKVVYYNAVPGSSYIYLTPGAVVPPAPPPVLSCDNISPGYRSWSLFLNPGTYGVFNFANTKILPSQAYTAYLPQDKSWPGWVNGMNCQHTYAITLPSMSGNRFPSVAGLNPTTGVAGVLVFTSYSDLALGANWWLDPKILAKIDAVAAFIPGVGVFGVWEK
jgi:peptidoglycan/xylan/chitin deacetylase (PgdA/CDA1 family)